MSRPIVHKSDSGLVRLALSDADAVREAFLGIAASLRKAGDNDAPTIVIQEMVQGAAELILGARHDASFGAQILLGFGGVMVEVLHDVQIASAPVSPDHVHAMLRRLKLWPILDGVRGRPRLDIDAVVDAATRLSWLAHDLGPRLRDLEINPLIVRIAGAGAIAVDGRGTIEQDH